VPALRGQGPPPAGAAVPRGLAPGRGTARRARVFRHATGRPAPVRRQRRPRRPRRRGTGSFGRAGRPAGAVDPASSARDDLPRVPVENRTVGTAFTTPDGTTYRPSMFVTLTARLGRDPPPDPQRVTNDAVRVAGRHSGHHHPLEAGVFGHRHLRALLAGLRAGALARGRFPHDECAAISAHSGARTPETAHRLRDGRLGCCRTTGRRRPGAATLAKGWTLPPCTNAPIAMGQLRRTRDESGAGCSANGWVDNDIGVDGARAASGRSEDVSPESAAGSGGRRVAGVPCRAPKGL